MSPSHIDRGVVATKVETIEEMLRGLRSLPSETLDEFLADSRNPAAAESYLRRALEALLDLGRHLLAKGFGKPVVEYAAIPESLREVEVISAELQPTFRKMARYRNRMVHGYDEVTYEELYRILTEHLGDFERLLGAIDRWLADHPEKVREEL